MVTLLQATAHSIIIAATFLKPWRTSTCIWHRASHPFLHGRNHPLSRLFGLSLLEQTRQLEWTMEWIVQREVWHIGQWIKLYEQDGYSSPMSIGDYNDEKYIYRYKEDTNNNTELRPLHRASIITPPQSNFTKRCLPEDTFSFLIYSQLHSRTFFLATLVFSLQIAIFVILTVDIIDVSNARNPMMFPPNVETPVRITEVLAIFINIRGIFGENIEEGREEVVEYLL